MAYYQLIDLGYLNKERNGSQATTMANSGDPIDIPYHYDIKTTSDTNHDTTPLAGSLDYNSTNKVSGSADTYTLELNLKNNDASDQEILKHLYGVRGNSSYPGIDKTDGIKALVISGTNTKKKLLVELIGEVGTDFHGNEITAGRQALFVEITKVVIRPNPAKNTFAVTINMVEA